MYNIEIINCLSDNYSYICFNDNEAFVVDPSEYTPIKNFLLEKNLDLKFILNTHHHHDHIGGNRELKKDYDCKIIAPKKDEKNVSNPESVALNHATSLDKTPVKRLKQFFVNEVF